MDGHRVYTHSLLFQYRFISLSGLKIKERACFSRYINKHKAYLY